MCAYLASSTAVSVGFVTDCGVRITSMPSLSWSSPATCSAFAYISGGASPSTSTGLLCDHAPGRNELYFSIASGEIFASWPPPVTISSVVITPGPPAFVITVMRGPLASGCLSSDAAMLYSCSIVSTRTTPAFLNAAVSTSSEPVSEPVCEAAAAAAAAVRPGLIT